MKSQGEEAPSPSRDEVPAVVPIEVGEEREVLPWSNKGTGEIGFVPRRGQELVSNSSVRTLGAVFCLKSNWKKSS